MNSNEQKIQTIHHCQIIPARYTINNQQNQFEYTFLQKLNVNTINLLSFSFYNIFENINQFYNTFVVQIAGSIYPVIIPENNYSFWDIFDLQTIIQTQLDAQIPGYNWTVSLTGNNNKFTTITNTSNVPFKFFYNLNPSQNQVLRYLGFGNSIDDAYTTYSTTHTSEYPYNVQVTTGIQVQCKNVGNLFSETIGVIALVPLSGAITTLIHYQSPFYQCNRVIIDSKHTYAIQDIQIQLLDDLNNPLNVLDTRISMNLMFEVFAKS